MNLFEPPDSHHLLAATGWLELGNHLEANEELEKITPQLRAHPDVLKIRWDIYAAANRWAEAVEIGCSIRSMIPGDSFGWVQSAYALHELKRTREAFEFLLPAASLFPMEGDIPYNLACYATQLGNLSEAKEWLIKAFNLDATLRLAANEDPDLELLWKNIGTL